jgi:hypothetical protein
MNGHVDAETSNSSDEEFSDAESEEEVESQEDLIVAAERATEAGNVQFKQQRYGNALDLYTQAHRECLVSNRVSCPPLLIGAHIRHTRLAWTFVYLAICRVERQRTELPYQPCGMLHGPETIQGSAGGLPGSRPPPARRSAT